MKLLIQAGKTNANGYIFLNENVPFSSEMLATIFNRPLTIVRLALNALSDFGMIDIEESGRILIENWDKHQNVLGLEKIREQGRIRAAKYRENKKLLISSVSINKTINKELDKDIDIEGNVIRNVTILEEQFEEFRRRYPGEKRGLTTEFEYFQKKHKDWIDITPTLLPALVSQIQQKEGLSKQGKFVPEWKHLKSWIYNKYWELEISSSDQEEPIRRLNG